MTDIRRASPLAMIVSIALAVAACGGASATATPAPVGEATPEATPTPTPAPVAGATPEATPEGALPTFNLEALTGALPGVDSYRTSTSHGGVKQYESVVVTKPELSKAITVYDDQGKVSNRYVIVGKDAWSADGPDGRFESVPAELATSLLMAFDPALMLGAYAQVDWSQMATNQGVEDKNGIQAHHVRIDSASFLGGAMPAGSAIDIWVADAGYLVAWEMSGFSPSDANLSIQVTNVNDSANKVEKPS